MTIGSMRCGAIIVAAWLFGAGTANAGCNDECRMKCDATAASVGMTAKQCYHVMGKINREIREQQVSGVRNPDIERQIRAVESGNFRSVE